MSNAQAKIRAIFGQRGSGKSELAKRLARSAPRVLYFDTTGRDYGSEGIVCYNRDQLSTLWRRVYQRRFRMVYRTADPLGDFPYVCDLAYDCGTLMLVVEEVHLFCRNGQFCPEFTKIITTGRHAGVDLIAVTQIPKGFGLLLKALAEDWYIFSTMEPDHIKYFQERCPGVTDIALLELPRYGYLHHVDGQGVWSCFDDLDGRHSRRREIVNYGRGTKTAGPYQHAGNRGPLGPEHQDGNQDTDDQESEIDSTSAEDAPSLSSD